MCAIAVATFLLFFVCMIGFAVVLGSDLTGVWLLIGIFAAVYLGRKWYGINAGSD